MIKNRILVFSTIAPYPLDRGDRNRLFHILKLLKQIGEVRLVYLRRDWEPSVDALDSLNGIELCGIPISKWDLFCQTVIALLNIRPSIVFRLLTRRIGNYVNARVHEFHPTVIWGYQVSSYPVLNRISGIKKVFDLVDSPSLYSTVGCMAHGISFKDKLFNKIQWRIKDYERNVILQNDIVLINSEQDMDHLNQLHGNIGKIMQLDNCVPGCLLDHQWEVPLIPPYRLLFVGNLAYPPNAAGVRCFAREILPLIREEEPDVEFIVCGANGTSLSRELRDVPSTRFTGYVDDLTAMYLESSVLVVPVPLAGGPQYKLLEGMALGVPVVASPASAGRNMWRDGQELLIRGSAEDFAAAVLAVLRNPELAKRLSSNARLYIQNHHLWENKLEVIRKALDSINC
jgi:glycosyltransferase involved in cell wall biosynthesis